MFAFEDEVTLVVLPVEGLLAISILGQFDFKVFLFAPQVGFEFFRVLGVIVDHCASDLVQHLEIVCLDLCLQTLHDFEDLVALPLGEHSFLAHRVHHDCLVPGEDGLVEFADLLLVRLLGLLTHLVFLPFFECRVLLHARFVIPLAPVVVDGLLLDALLEGTHVHCIVDGELEDLHGAQLGHSPEFDSGVCNYFRN